MPSTIGQLHVSYRGSGAGARGAKWRGGKLGTWAKRTPRGTRLERMEREQCMGHARGRHGRVGLIRWGGWSIRELSVATTCGTVSSGARAPVDVVLVSGISQGREVGVISPDIDQSQLRSGRRNERCRSILTRP